MDKCEVLSGLPSCKIAEKCKSLQDIDNGIHVNYCKAEYEDKYLYEVENGAAGIIDGDLLKTKLAVLKRLENTNNKLLDSFKGIEHILLSQGKHNSEIWYAAIHESISNYPSRDRDLVINSSLATYKKEFDRVGASNALSDVKNSLREKMADYDNAKYPNTFQIYAVLSQMIAHVEELRGSLKSYNQTVNSLQSEFDKYYALAELENPIPKVIKMHSVK